MKFNIFILTFFILSITLNAQESNTFSLKQAIDYAIEHSSASKNATRDIEAAVQRKWETTATGLPQISAEISYNHWLQQQVQLLPAEFVGGTPGEYIEATFGTVESMTATATLNQLLFDGSYLVGLQSAKVYLEISENAKIKTDLEVRKAVINAYGNVLLAQESVLILEKNITNLEKTLFETEETFKNGLTEQENVEQLQITLSNVENGLRNATRMVDLSKKLLNITLGIDLTNPLILSETLSDITTSSTNLSAISTTTVVENTIDYKIANNEMVSNQLLWKLEKSKALPTLSAFINGQYAGYGDTFTFNKKDQKWLGSSLVGVKLNVPIFSSLGRTAATKRAEINFDKSEESLSQTIQEIQLSITKAKSDYQFSIENLGTSQKNLGLAERIEHKNNIKFTEGISSSFELRQAQLQLYSSQNEYLQAMLDVIVKKAELDNVTNK
ncbi:MAG: transporter [Flavobacteriaceae bacterium]|nr:MAG: transporter [Flavobacteriaceae bacterium]